MPDIRTIFLSYLLTDLVCLIVVVFLWQQNRRRFAGLHLWIANFLIQLAALVLIVLRGWAPDWASIVLAHGLILSGTILGLAAIERFVGLPGRHLHNLLMLVATVLIHLYFTYVSPNLAARTFNTSAALFFVFFQCARLALFRTAPALLPFTRTVGLVFVFYCLISVARMAVALFGAPGRTDFFAESAFEASVLIAYQMLFIALTFSLALMVNGRLRFDLFAQEEKFHKAFHSSPCAIVMTRLSDGAILDVNEGFERLTGYTRKESAGKTTSEMNLWLDEEHRTAFLDALVRDGSIKDRELRLKKQSGEIMTGLLSAEKISIGGQTCVLSSINDITDRKKMESDLRKSEAMLRAVMDNLPIGVAVNSVDPEVHFTYANENFTRFYKTTPEAINAPDGFWEAVYENPKTREEIRKRVLADCASADPARMVWENIPIERTGEETSYVSARNIPIPDSSLVLSTVWDVTDAKKAHEEIRQLNEALERKVNLRTKELRDNQLALLNIVDDLNETARNLALANQSLEAVNKELAAFSYSVSHDLRAPLRSIDGFGSALLEDDGDKLSDEGRNYLERIRRATQNMGRLIDDLLSLSRVTQSDLEREDIDLSAMAREIVQTHRERIPGSTVDVDIEEGMRACADPRLMRIALINLLDNAWKFTSKVSAPHVTFGATTQAEDTVFFIRDNGVGFDMKYAGKLFGTFQRLHRTDEFPGTGIGLATVQRIIHRHGGRIWAEAEQGKGAAFYFTLGG